MVTRIAIKIQFTGDLMKNWLVSRSPMFFILRRERLLMLNFLWDMALLFILELKGWIREDHHVASAKFFITETLDSYLAAKNRNIALRWHFCLITLVNVRADFMQFYISVFWCCNSVLQFFLEGSRPVKALNIGSRDIVCAASLVQGIQSLRSICDGILRNFHN